MKQKEGLYFLVEALCRPLDTSREAPRRPDAMASLAEATWELDGKTMEAG